MGPISGGISLKIRVRGANYHNYHKNIDIRTLEIGSGLVAKRL